MTFVAACLLIALAAAGTIVVILMGALYRLAVERNEDRARAERFAREADEFQDLYEGALNRLSRKPKSVVAGGGAA